MTVPGDEVPWQGCVWQMVVLGVTRLGWDGGEDVPRVRRPCLFETKGIMMSGGGTPYRNVLFELVPWD